MNQSKTIGQLNGFWAIGLKLAILGFPVVIGWIVKLELTQAENRTQQRTIDSQQTKIERMEGDIGNVKVNSNELKNISGRLDRIEDKLDRLMDR